METKTLINLLQSFKVDEELNVLRLEQYGFLLIGRGTDRDVYLIPETEYVLKTAIGPQEKTIPEQWAHLYLPYEEFLLPVTVQSGSTEQILNHETTPHRWGQIQPICRLPKIMNINLSDPELDRFIYSSCNNKEFIQALLDYYKYSQDEIKDFINAASAVGMRSISSSNWGFFNELPVVFDYGGIILEEKNE